MGFITFGGALTKPNHRRTTQSAPPEKQNLTLEFIHSCNPNSNLGFQITLRCDHVLHQFDRFHSGRRLQRLHRLQLHHQEKRPPTCQSQRLTCQLPSLSLSLCFSLSRAVFLFLKVLRFRWRRLRLLAATSLVARNGYQLVQYLTTFIHT